MDWLRWYHGTVNDPKWRVVARRSGLPVAAVLGVWAALLETASQNDERGTLEGWDAEDIGAALDLEPEQVQAIVDAMQGKVLEGPVVKAWAKRQPKRDREDHSTERVRAHRERMKRHETPSNALEEIRVEEIREEVTTTTTSPSGEVLAGEPATTPPSLALVATGNGNGKTQPLPARRDLTSESIREQLVQVHAEIVEGTRNRLRARQARTLAAGMVFSYWAARTGHERSLLDPKRESLILSRLKESGGNVSEMLYAVDGALRDPWHNGEKDQTKRMGVEMIFRHRAKVEELAGLMGGYRQEKPHPMSEKYAEIFNDEAAA